MSPIPYSGPRVPEGEVEGAAVPRGGFPVPEGEGDGSSVTGGEFPVTGGGSPVLGGKGTGPPLPEGGVPDTGGGRKRVPRYWRGVPRYQRGQGRGPRLPGGCKPVAGGGGVLPGLSPHLSLQLLLPGPAVLQLLPELPVVILQAPYLLPQLRQLPPRVPRRPPPHPRYRRRRCRSRSRPRGLFPGLGGARGGHRDRTVEPGPPRYNRDPPGAALPGPGAVGTLIARNGARLLGAQPARGPERRRFYGRTGG